MATQEFRVEGMSCAHCEGAVRDEVAKLAGVEAIDVSAAAGTLTVTATAPLDRDDVAAAVDEAGYELASA